MESTKQSSAVLDLTPRIVARAVSEALLPLGVELPALDVMVRGAGRLAGACRRHGWNDWEAVDFIQQFASDAIGEGAGWKDWVAKTFNLLRVWKDGQGKCRVRGALDLDRPAARNGEGATLAEAIAAPTEEREALLNVELPPEVEPAADFLRDSPAKTIAEARGVSARMGRYDTQKLIEAAAMAVRDPGLFRGVLIDPAAWAARPKTGKGGRPSKAALAQRAAAQQQQGLF